MAQFDALLAILEPHIKNKTISVNSVCNECAVFFFLLDNRHSGFWRSLRRWI